MSRYRNAAEILPADLLAALQEYAAGQQLYVPPLPSQRRKWGERSGAREALAERNHAIRTRRAAGADVETLMAEFHLGYDSIRKILNGKNGSTQSRN